ncbi:MAG: hypothetical protein ACFFDN_35270, partial [Candidatus Hodarchaeota archaeon]
MTQVILVKREQQKCDMGNEVIVLETPMDPKQISLLLKISNDHAEQGQNPRHFEDRLTVKKAKQRDWARYGSYFAS